MYNGWTHYIAEQEAVIKCAHEYSWSVYKKAKQERKNTYGIFEESVFRCSRMGRMA